MILLSRVTIVSFLLALMLVVGLWRWNMGHHDACSAYLAGEPKAPSSMYVITGTRTVEVPCTQWLPRQPEPVQLLCLADFVLWMIFLVRAIGDAVETIARWRTRRASSDRLAP